MWLVVMLPAGLIAYILPALRDPDSSGLSSNDFLIGMLLFGIAFILILLALRWRYRVAAALAIGAGVLIPLGLFAFVPRRDLITLTYLIVPVMLSALYFRLWVSLLLIALIVALMIVVVAQVTPEWLGHTFDTLLPFFLFAALLILIMRRHVNQISQRQLTAQMKEEERFRTLSELMSDYAYSIELLPDGSRRVAWLSGAFTEITGYTPHDAASGRWEAIIHPDDMPQVEARLARLEAGESNEGELRIITKDGRVRWLRDYSRPVLREGRLTGIIGASKDITAQKEAEEQFKLLALTIHNADEGVALIRARQSTEEGAVVLFASDGMTRITGYSREEIIGQSPYHFFEQSFVKDLGQRLSGGQPCEGDSVNYRKDGSLYHAEWRVSPILSKGRITHYAAILRDVTARKMTELAEREQRRLADALRDTTTALTSTLEVEEVLDRIVDNLQSVLPFDLAAVMLVEGDEVHTARLMRQQVAPHQTVDVHRRFSLSESSPFREVVAADAAVLIDDTRLYPNWENVNPWIRAFFCAPIRANNALIGFLCLASHRPGAFSAAQAVPFQLFADQAGIALRNARVFDLTRQQNIELEERVAARTIELEREQGQLQAIMDGMGEGMLYIEGGVIQYCNLALLRLTGYTPADIIGAPITRLTVPGAIDLTLSPGRKIIQISGRDGRAIDVALTISRASGPDGRVMGAVVVVRDVRKEKARQLRQRRFLAVASHELRTPITNILTRLYLLRRQPDRIDDHLPVLEEVAGRIRRLTDYLMDNARLESGDDSLIEKREMVLNTMVEQVMRAQMPSAEMKRIDLEAELPADMLVIDGDADRLNQVVTNLVTNAIRYTPVGGAVRVALVAEADCALLSVTDTGEGIASENLELIFDPFFRASSAAGGSGLGLSIAREIVNLHGGTIHVESTPGAGSRFEVRLPLT